MDYPTTRVFQILTLILEDESMWFICVPSLGQGGSQLVDTPCCWWEDSLQTFDLKQKDNKDEPQPYGDGFVFLLQKKKSRCFPKYFRAECTVSPSKAGDPGCQTGVKSLTTQKVVRAISWSKHKITRAENGLRKLLPIAPTFITFNKKV